jgi:phosphatidylserine decarboxylase
MKFAREGWVFVLPFWLLGGVLLLLGHPGWGAGLLVAGLAVLLFFRDPLRAYQGTSGIVVAPADGLVTRIDRLEDPEIGPGAYHRIVTFLSVFDVHVQRTPCEGEVVASRYAVGRKVAAFREDAGEVNEKHLTVLRRASGDLVGVRQIAGLLARRVVCYLKEGQRVERGQSMGLIKFGSRVDLLVPASYRLLVAKGDRLKNGATAVAQPESAREEGP